jgi:ankyrin repeat protein
MSNVTVISNVTIFHEAVKLGELERIRALLAKQRELSNARSEADARGTYPLHVAAQFGQVDAALMLIEHGADVTLLDTENDATALCWAAFFGRPKVVQVLLDAGSDPSARNKHCLTPLGCAVGGTEGRWEKFSNATREDWRKAAEQIRARRGVE